MSTTNQQSGGSGSTVKVKAGKPTKPAGRYDWGKGGKTHSISLAAHKRHTAGGGGGSNPRSGQPTQPNQDLTAPPTFNNAMGEATAAADLQYGPAVNAARQAAANVDPWFRDYMARVAGYATAAQAQAAPIVTGAQTFQQNTGAQLPPGLDPNSEAGKAAAMAAQGRQALAALGTQALQTNAQSTQDMFGGMNAVAARQQPQAQAAAQTQLANAQGQRGAAVTNYLTTARQNAQNYQIARGTLAGNLANQAADNATQTAGLTETVRHHTASEKAAADARTKAAAEKGQTVNKYGYTNEQWSRFSASHRQRIIKAAGTNSTAAADAKDAQKHAAAITKASGDVQNTITDIIGEWNNHVGKETDDTSKPKDPKTGQYPARKLTPNDIKAILGQNKAYTPQLIHIALLRRVGKPLDQASIDYLHNLNPDIRIPSAWLPKHGRGVAGRPGNAPAGSTGGSGQSRPT